jgi:1,4-alpha-glucan branching enzyme
VEIMPIKEFPGTVGWGYTPRYYFAIENSYGTTAELKEMIDTFHKNGIRVFMDGVYNHVSICFVFATESIEKNEKYSVVEFNRLMITVNLKILLKYLLDSEQINMKIMDYFLL